MKQPNGFSLLEVLVAISMLALLLTGGFSVLRIVLKSSERIQRSIAAGNRVSSAETALREEIANLIPVGTQCASAGGGPNIAVPFFEGEQDELRFVSGYSLAEKFRGSAQFTEWKVIPSSTPGELRLIANQRPWLGVAFVAPCLLSAQIHFSPVQSSPSSFVLADKLPRCAFSYLYRSSDAKPIWAPRLPIGEGFPEAIRIEALTTSVIPIHARGD